MRSSSLVAFLMGCSFSSSVDPSATDGKPLPKDGREIDTPDGYVADARMCFGAGFGMMCLPTLPSMPRQLPNQNNFDTSNAGNCTHLITVGGVETCVLTGTTVTLPSGSTFRAIGTRPLVIVATQTMQIDGDLSVASQRQGGGGAGASSAPCTNPAAPQNDTGGGGGGAGGTFGGQGGIGGDGDLNQSGGADGVGDGGNPAATVTPATIRAGCRGGAGGNGGGSIGAPGIGGGAIYLIAGTSIHVTGGVFAGGAGATGSTDQSGGSGGGSGGLIGLDAPSVVIDGAAVANGGGGSEGGGLGGQLGGPGGDGTETTTRATGGQAAAGDGGTGDGGNGGQGSAGGNLGGTGGGGDNGGGGGGGGGAGYIYVKGTLTGAGTISPSASVT